MKPLQSIKQQSWWHTFRVKVLEKSISMFHYPFWLRIQKYSYFSLYFYTFWSLIVLLHFRLTRFGTFSRITLLRFGDCHKWENFTLPKSLDRIKLWIICRNLLLKLGARRTLPQIRYQFTSLKVQKAQTSFRFNNVSCCYV